MQVPSSLLPSTSMLLNIKVLVCAMLCGVVALCEEKGPYADVCVAYLAT